MEELIPGARLAPFRLRLLGVVRGKVGGGEKVEEAKAGMRQLQRSVHVIPLVTTPCGLVCTHMLLEGRVRETVEGVAWTGVEVATIGMGLVSIGAVSKTSGGLVVASQRRVGGFAASSSIKSVKQ